MTWCHAQGNSILCWSIIPHFRQGKRGRERIFTEVAEIARARYPSVAALTKLLSDPYEGCRNNGAIALRAIAAEARSALPALRKNLKDPKRTIRENSRAIAAIEAAIPQVGPQKEKAHNNRIESDK